MPLSIRLPKDMESRLSNLSKEANISQAQIIKEAISAHLEDLEDYYKAIKALERIKKGEKTYSSHEVFKELGLE
jgi:RHH-type rel operon transcriptional repressor/antitoxin RelB